jgi:hypothetical protein
MGNNDQVPAAGYKDWELSKENFQPLKGGRKTYGLQDPVASVEKLSVEERRK